MLLKIIGQKVSEVIVGFTVTIRMGQSSEFELQIEGEIDLRLPTGDIHHVTAEKYADIQPELNAIVGSAVLAADADEVHGLVIDFESGNRITIPVDQDYEAWNVTGPDGYRVISLPGGELAFWSAKN
ncbi:DUF6188 family protein [Nocardia sp. NBC_00511]|uniref:DUF6188 family protein n=1 Tax=Nocardia sp. NBC_00511 TaxID=2903591 RepID=UPI0030E22B57